MANLNKIMIIGNVGSDPEMRYTPSGIPVTSFSIATNHFYNGPDGERKQETEWFRVTTWNKLAETCNQFLAKGRQAYVEGRLHTRVWEARDGQKRTSVEITASTVLFLDKMAAASLPEASGQADEIEPEDLPLN